MSRHRGNSTSVHSVLSRQSNTELLLHKRSQSCCHQRAPIQTRLTPNLKQVTPDPFLLDHRTVRELSSGWISTAKLTSSAVSCFLNLLTLKSHSEMCLWAYFIRLTVFLYVKTSDCCKIQKLKRSESAARNHREAINSYRHTQLQLRPVACSHTDRWIDTLTRCTQKKHASTSRFLRKKKIYFILSKILWI